MTAIQLIVGLGNPGNKYASTRHNAGAWFIEYLCSENNVTLKLQGKCEATIGQLTLAEKNIRVAIPHVYMNLSGQALQLICNFYKIASQAVIVVHDDMDLDPGTVKLKIGGGHGGHNGLRDIHNKLGTDQYQRLRIGVGHPQNPRISGADYVLSTPTSAEDKLIRDSIYRAYDILPLLVTDQTDKAMQQLHTLPPSA